MAELLTFILFPFDKSQKVNVSCHNVSAQSHLGLATFKYTYLRDWTNRKTAERGDTVLPDALGGVIHVSVFLPSLLRLSHAVLLLLGRVNQEVI